MKYARLGANDLHPSADLSRGQSDHAHVRSKTIALPLAMTHSFIQRPDGSFDSESLIFVVTSGLLIVILIPVS